MTLASFAAASIEAAAVKSKAAPERNSDRDNPHYSRVTELLVVQAFSSVMTQMDAGVMTIEAMRRPVG